MAAAARLFDVEHDHDLIHEHLHRSKPLKQRLANLPGMRPLGAWSPFELCIRTILGQQVTVAAAGTLMRRLVERCGSITPECVVAADVSNMGMPGKRAAALQSFAQAIVDGRVDFSQPWAQVDTALQTLPGFGPWTRAYLAIRLGRDRDVFPGIRYWFDPCRAGGNTGRAAQTGRSVAAAASLCGDLFVGGGPVELEIPAVR